MDKQSRTYQAYVKILKEELIPAMGCTEPIAIAYAAAKARDVLGGMPDKVEIGVSSNIIKNVKSVIVPNTDGMKGIEAAAAAGIVGGQADKALEVISAVTADQKAAMRTFLKQVPVTVKAIDNGFIFDIIVTLRQGDDSAVVRWQNVFFAGRSLGGYDYATEKSGHGVAIATGWQAGLMAAAAAAAGENQ